MTPLRNMSTYLLRTLAAVTLFSAVLISSCKEDDPIKPVIIQFALESQSVAENAATPVTVTVQFDGAATKDGTVSVSLTSTTATYGTHYTTNPAATSSSFVLNITKGQSAAQFTVTPVNNEILDGDKSIMFTLSNPSSGLQLGTRTSYILTITDDEGPTKANFAIGNDEVAENAEEKIVTINLTSAAPGTGTVVVAFTSDNAEYGTHFTTDPAAIAGKLTLNVAANATSVTFKVLPVDDEEVNDNRVITFTIDEATGVIEKGTNLTYILTIVNDDLAETATSIAEVRAMFEGSQITITDDIFIQGVITSNNNNVTSRNAFIQDETGAIQLRFVNNNVLARGDEVTVLLKDVVLGLNAGLLQLGGSGGMPNTNANKIGDGVLPDYEIITLEELNSNEFESKLVKVADVIFPDADGTLTMSGNKTVSDGSITSIVRSETYAPWASSPVPVGYGNIQGIATQFNGTAQIIPQVFADDVFTNNPLGTLTITQSLTDFGTIDNGNESASQNYTVEGSGLIDDLIITAPANFKVSLDDATFNPSITFTAAEVNGMVKQVYVKFAPNSGVDGAKTGAITHKTQGILTQSIDVEGTESGNTGTTNVLLEENFDYGGTDTDILTATSNWTRHSGAQGPQYTASGLSYTGYPGSGVGGAVSFTNGGSGVNDGDVNRAFTAVTTTNDIYVSFLVNLESAMTTTDYFFHLGPDPVGTTFRGRIFARTNSDGWSLNFGKSGNTDTDNTVLEFNKTYLFVMKYSFNTTAANDDLVSLFVFDGAIPTSESDSPIVSIGPVGQGVGSDPANIGTVSIRQGTNTPTGKIDGIRVALSWSDLFN